MLVMKHYQNELSSFDASLMKHQILNDPQLKVLRIESEIFLCGLIKLNRQSSKTFHLILFSKLLITPIYFRIYYSLILYSLITISQLWELKV